MTELEGDKGGQKGGGSGDQKITVGEKEYSVDDVTNLLAQTATLTKKGESVQKVIDVCARYDMEPGDYADQSMSAFSTINNLIQEGVIDAEGNIVKPEPKAKDPEDDLLNLEPKAKPAAKPASTADATILKAIEGVNKTQTDMAETVKRLESIQTSMIHDSYRDKITAKFPALSDKDADHVLAVAMQDTKKDVWGHAEDVVAAKAASTVAMNKAYCEEHGLNYEELERQKADENELEEQSAEGGAAAMHKGKKFRFNPKGDDEMTPLKASQAYYDKTLGGD